MWTLTGLGYAAVVIPIFLSVIPWPVMGLQKGGERDKTLQPSSVADIPSVKDATRNVDHGTAAISYAVLAAQL